MRVHVCEGTCVRIHVCEGTCVRLHVCEATCVFTVYVPIHHGSFPLWR